jgi:glyoxylase-like metal-dependent hydrolase (beta-lactamase superfamily II)
VVFTRPGDATDDPIMFSGDVLFAGSIGRTDLAGGDSAAMRESLERVIITADDATIVLPGHGPQTTIGAERVANPFLQFGGGFGAAPSRGM